MRQQGPPLLAMAAVTAASMYLAGWRITRCPASEQQPQQQQQQGHAPPPAKPEEQCAEGTAAAAAAEAVAAAVGEAGEAAPVWKIVLTGGPCAGKTTACKQLTEFFTGKGFRVFAVPEAATILFSHGVSVSDLEASPLVRFAFQSALMRLQMELEDSLERIAKETGQPSILLCDRGTMDGAAYVSADMWEALLEERGILHGEGELREGRYDAVFHLITAADGAEDFYSLENNDARTETIEAARQMDQRSSEVWLGHPQHFMFPNHPSPGGEDYPRGPSDVSVSEASEALPPPSSFQQKLDRVQRVASRLVGLPTIRRNVEKFYLSEPPDVSTFPVPYKTFEVEQVFLNDSALELPGAPSLSQNNPPHRITRKYGVVRKRTTSKGFSSYDQANVALWSDGRRTESARRISAAHFEALALTEADPSRAVVRQRRVSFVWRRQCYTVYTYLLPITGLSLLYCQDVLGEQEQRNSFKRHLPPFLKVANPVAPEPMLDEGVFSAYRISVSRTVPEVDP